MSKIDKETQERFAEMIDEARYGIGILSLVKPHLVQGLATRFAMEKVEMTPQAVRSRLTELANSPDYPDLTYKNREEAMKDRQVASEIGRPPTHIWAKMTPMQKLAWANEKGPIGVVQTQDPKLAGLSPMQKLHYANQKQAEAAKKTQK